MSSLHKDAAIDWVEAHRFDRWIRFNTPALMRKIADIKEREPWRENTKGIVIASEIYRHSGGATVSE